MPENPSHDDRFADLFSKLPAPQRGDAPPETPTGQVPPAAPPLSRRAAREAARATDPESPASAPESVPAEADTDAAEDESTVADEQAAVAPRRASPTIDALFTEDEPEDLVRAKHERDRRKSRVAGWVIFGVTLAILGGIGVGVAYVWNTYEQPIRELLGWTEPKDFEEGLAEGEVLITIVDGDTGADISRTLHDAGVTKTPSAFYDYLIGTAQEPRFFPGVFALQYQMTSAAALEAILDPASRRENTAQLREGLTVAQTLTRLADAVDLPIEDFEAAIADPSAYGVAADSLEGWLFPATYTFDPDATAEEIIRTLVNQTVTSLDRVEVPEDRRQEILTIASIIEREARLNDDFYRVSRVIQIRLDDGMLLQMDSTSQFGFGQLDDGSVSTSDEAQYDDNPWNTYVHAGLPIGPIANPGDTAIKAAMEPADGPWLYFVTVNLDTGETVFTTTYSEHLQAVEQWQAWCADNPDSGC